MVQRCRTLLQQPKLTTLAENYQFDEMVRFLNFSEFTPELF